MGGEGAIVVIVLLGYTLFAELKMTTFSAVDEVGAKLYAVPCLLLVCIIYVQFVG